MSIALKLQNSFYFNPWFPNHHNALKCFPQGWDILVLIYLPHSSSACLACNIPGAHSPHGWLFQLDKTCLDLPSPGLLDVCTDHSRWGTPCCSPEPKCSVSPLWGESNASLQLQRWQVKKELSGFICTKSLWPILKNPNSFAWRSQVVFQVLKY